jgi:RimJ/RimL family protein N-acetyltransferase
MARLPEEVLARRGALPLKPAPVTLRGKRVEMRPLVDDDLAPLHAISTDEEMWRYMSGGPFADVAALAAWLAPQRAAPDGLPLTVRLDGAPVGVACFIANQPQHLKIELGSIWYGPIGQRTGASREATELMLAHAFGLGYRRVEWKCDARNERSRRAALSYGFVFEGIQDAHYIIKDQNRDTAWFRMLETDYAARRTM